MARRDKDGSCLFASGQAIERVHAAASATPRDAARQEPSVQAKFLVLQIDLVGQLRPGPPQLAQHKPSSAPHT
jgi:hypothetical protein